MLAIGAVSAKVPKPVISNWPGRVKEQHHQGRDRLHTTDFSDLLGDVIGDHRGNSTLQTVLPNHDFKPAGLV